MVNIPVIVIFAPTATGKTALAIDLFGSGSHSFFKDKAELISADSMQVYKGMDIGTAKPSEYEKSQLKHHLIDLQEIDQPFSVAHFVEQADVLCKEIYSRGKIPVIAGGTGFYIRNFILGLPETPESNPVIRDQLKKRLEDEGNEAMYQELQKIDPESASKIHINDSYRVLRALEVYYTTGKIRSSYQMNKPREGYDFKVIILERNREVLYQRINLRVDKMFESGLENEVKKLISKGADAQMPGMQAIGYREWFEYEDLEMIREKIKHNSRKYAKKQYTFMAGIPDAVYIDADNSENLVEAVSEKIKDIFD